MRIVSGSAVLSGDDQAGVEADAHLEGRYLACPAQFFRVVLDRGQDGQAGAYRTLGIVLVGQGGAKKGQHAVAQELSDRAFVAIDRLGQPAVRARHDLAPVFGVHRFGQAGRADDVGKQHRDQLALTFDAAAFGHDLVDEGGGCGLAQGGQGCRSYRRWRGGCWGCKFEAAVATEFGGGRHRFVTVGTGAGQGLAAVFTKACRGVIGVRTVLAFHGLWFPPGCC